jgi:flagellar motor switch protein FliM
MSGFLDANEIEKLFARASEGTLPTPAEQHAQQAGRRARWLRTVDFTRPTKFSTDQERRMRRALDTFTERAATRLVAEHRTPMEIEVIDVGQFTWHNAFSQVPDPSVYITLECAPHDGRLLLTAELPIVLIALERMLGGKPETAPRDRELTDIDLMVVHRLFSTIVEALSSILFDTAEMNVSIATVDTQHETVQVTSGAEPTLALTLEARLDGLSNTMSLLVPYARDERTAAAVNHGLSLVDVTLRAEVADATLTLEEVLALQPGDVVRLDAPADAEVTIFADRTPVHRARGGRSGTRRAVQITTPVEPAT